MAFAELDRIINGSNTVVGLGVSGRAVIDFLLSRGARVTARDAKSSDALGELARDLERRGVRLYCGEKYLEDLTEDVIFRTPGMYPHTPALEQARARGAMVTSEMELFLSLCPAHVIGITGSDGKTTTTTLCGMLLEAECAARGRGKVYVGGNIGEPLLPYVGEMTEEDYAVVELSSFQLQTFDRSVERAALTNVTENHLNWHKSMAEYTAAKSNIYRHEGNGLLVANAENEATERLAGEYAGRVTLISSMRADPESLIRKPGDSAMYLSDGCICRREAGRHERILSVDRIRVPGRHNIENFMSAIALTWGLVSRENILRVADTFLGVRHRLELVGTAGGVTYYNSSIDTTPARTCVTLEALSHRHPVVICGGSSKNTPFLPLADALIRHASGVVLTGETAPLIKEALLSCEGVERGAFPIWEEPDFTRAVQLASEKAGKDGTVLLSPACASFDAFQDYKERGDLFCNLVRLFQEEEPS